MADFQGSTGASGGRAEPGGWGALVAAPMEVIRLLRGEPILLIGMGAAVLLTLMALFGPDGTQLYALTIAALVVVLVVIRAITMRRERSASPGSGVEISARRGSRIAKIWNRDGKAGGIRIKSSGSSVTDVRND